MRNRFTIKRYVFLLLQSGAGAPYSLRIDTHRLSTLFLMTFAVLATTSLGTILFFRELELNRKLSERVLLLETNEKIADSLSKNSRFVANLENPPASATSQATEQVNVKAEKEPASTNEPSKALGEVVVGARIADLSTDCDGETCNTRLALVPTTTGIAQGQLLIVLETEIPRIGAGNPTTQVRKRFFTYPGNQVYDDLTQEALSGLERKPFRFSRALSTQSSFKIGKLLRPLALNIYLYDKEKTLIHHERKSIETEETP